MNTKDLSILIVDDTKFSSAIVAKTLRTENYLDLRTAKSAAEALELIKSRPIDILLADWLMPEMDGLELTKHIRDLDEATGQYTYVILLTAKDGVEALSEAFDAGVDEFINKSLMREQLIPRIFAATRLVTRQNKLLSQNRTLAAAKHELESLNTLDPLTKVGNEKYANMRIADTLRFVESRGGALCYLHFNIIDLPQLRKEYRPMIIDQVIISFAKRMLQLLRPLDALTRLSESEFGVIQHQSSIDICDGKIFKRILDGLAIKPYETDAGYISVRVSASLVGVGNQLDFFPDSKSVLTEARARINTLDATGHVNTFLWTNLR